MNRHRGALAEASLGEPSRERIHAAIKSWPVMVCPVGPSINTGSPCRVATLSKTRSVIDMSRGTSKPSGLRYNWSSGSRSVRGSHLCLPPHTASQVSVLATRRRSERRHRPEASHLGRASDDRTGYEIDGLSEDLAPCLYIVRHRFSDLCQSGACVSKKSRITPEGPGKKSMKDQFCPIVDHLRVQAADRPGVVWCHRSSSRTRVFPCWDEYRNFLHGSVRRGTLRCRLP
jgi:hypothetical protein